MAEPIKELSGTAHILVGERMVVVVGEDQSKICRRCHHKLKDDNSIKLGFGKICYLKYMQSKKSYLFEIEGGETNDSRKSNWRDCWFKKSTRR